MTTNAAAAKAIIDRQAVKGRAHYGVGLEKSSLSVSALARDGAEEAADLLAYMVELTRRAEALEAENIQLREQTEAVLSVGDGLAHMVAKLLDDAKRRQETEPNAGTAARIDEAMGLLCAYNAPRPGLFDDLSGLTAPPVEGPHFWESGKKFPHSYEADGTSNCAHGCGCWAGPARSGGPDGVDPFGECPAHPARVNAA